jgi:benzoyl-CoA reductase/2-hydroxyglutaryl-CoA dehydratase subunit BcrC/BadD/HgdB
MYYDRLLWLCGYEPEGVEAERVRIEKAFEKLDITPEDIERAEQWIKKHCDVELKSIRKFLGIQLKGIIDLILAKEERDKIVYADRPSFFQVLNAMAMVSQKIYVNTPDSVVADVGMFFGIGKLSPFLEAAEGDLLPAGSAFCAGIQAKLGGLIKRVIPVPDLLVSSGFVCDQAPKVDEFISWRYNIPVAYVDCAHGEKEDEWPHPSEKRVKYLAEQGRVALELFREVTGYTITEDVAKKADLRVADLALRRQRIFDLLKSVPYVLTGYHNISMVTRVSSTGVNTTTLYGDLEGILDLLYSELKERAEIIEKKVVLKDAPRVGIYGLLDASVTSLMENAGLKLVDLRLSTTKSERTALNRYQDFWERSAERMLSYCSRKFARRIVQLCKEEELDSLVLNYVIGCRDLCITPFKIRDLVTKELNIPVLMLEVNLCDTRDYSPETMKGRVEAFTEVVKASMDDKKTT